MKILFFNRSSVHYRKAIYKLLEKELNMDFCFGDSRPGNIKKVDNGYLKKSKCNLENVIIKEPIYWQKGTIGLLSNGYDAFLTAVDYWCISAWVFAFICKIKNKKLYFWTHGWYGNENYLKKAIKKIFYSFATGIFLYGEYSKKLMVSNGYNANKLHVIYNSLDYDSQIIQRAKLTPNCLYKNKFCNEFKTLIFIGRLTKIKRLDMILMAMDILAKESFYCNVVFIGDGEMKENLKNMVKDLEFEERAWFYGDCYNEDELSNLIYQSDLCVSPGNVGLTAMHSMTYGTPVITHNCFSKQMPEFEAIEHNKTGAFFEYSSVQSLSKTIKKWFLENKDREKTRTCCYKVIDGRYNPYKQIEIIKSVINS